MRRLVPAPTNSRFLGIGLFLYARLGLAGAQATPDFASASWVPLTMVFGAPVVDAALDTSASAPGRDIVGDTTNAAAFVASDAGFLYFRLRVDGAANLASFGYGCEIDTNGNSNGYELFALTNKTSVVLDGNAGGPDSPADTAETVLQTYPLATYATSGSAGTTFTGTADAFVSWAVAWSDLSANGVSTYAPLRFVCGANASGSPTLTTGLSGDVLGEGSADPLTWHQLASDQYQCGAANCCSSSSLSGPGPFISADNATFTIGLENAFQVIAIGCPLPALSTSDALPTGITFDPASGVLSGTAEGAAEGAVGITFTASNVAGSDAQQSFTLSIVVGDRVFGDGFEIP
jgi:hypothetical protein